MMAARLLLGLAPRACRVGMSASSRSISLRMIAGIIWKVEALPTPLDEEQEEEHGEEAGEVVLRSRK